MQLSLKLNDQGVVALFTVVVVSVAVLLMAYGVWFLSLGELEMGNISQQADQSFYYADGCLEEALHQIRLDSAYAGGILNTSTFSCIIDVEGAGSSRVIIVSSTAGDFSKRIRAQVSLSNRQLNIDGWEEI
ncbi:MAG: hypothetical protein ABIH87_03080 [bacterium]